MHAEQLIVGGKKWKSHTYPVIGEWANKLNPLIESMKSNHNDDSAYIIIKE